MNFVWDIVLRARRCGMASEDLFFQQAEQCSPWYEQSFPIINEETVAGEAVDINALYRFSDIFAALLHKDLDEHVQFRNYLLDAAIHILCETDLHHGLSKREFYIRKLMQELLEGGFGRSVKSGFLATPSDKRKRLASLVLSQFQIGASLLNYRKAVLVLYPEAILYQVRDDPKQLLLYLGVVETEQRIKEVRFLQEMFLPVSYQLRIFWTHHFGMIGVKDTMYLDELEIY